MHLTSLERKHTLVASICGLGRGFNVTEFDEKLSQRTHGWKIVLRNSNSVSVNMHSPSALYRKVLIC